jgi:hypothetical protein
LPSHALEAKGHHSLYDPVNTKRSPCATAAEERTPGIPDPMGPLPAAPSPVGGELTLEGLDLAYGSVSKFYQAPVQMSANGGVLVIDDFGRQRCSPASILNRWITPLESRVDYLTLQTGQKLPMPFGVLVVFATNIKPTELVDEAFLRRIHYKVFAESPRSTTSRRSSSVAASSAASSMRRGPGRSPDCRALRAKAALRGCHPAISSRRRSRWPILGEPEHLTDSLLTMAFQTYFVDDRSVSGTQIT